MRIHHPGGMLASARSGDDWKLGGGSHEVGSNVGARGIDDEAQRLEDDRQGKHFGAAKYLKVWVPESASCTKMKRSAAVLPSVCYLHRSAWQ